MGSYGLFNFYRSQYIQFPDPFKLQKSILGFSSFFNLEKLPQPILSVFFLSTIFFFIPVPVATLSYKSLSWFGYALFIHLFLLCVCVDLFSILFLWILPSISLPKHLCAPSSASSNKQWSFTNILSVKTAAENNSVLLLIDILLSMVFFLFLLLKMLLIPNLTDLPFAMNSYMKCSIQSKTKEIIKFSCHINGKHKPYLKGTRQNLHSKKGSFFFSK